jgi:hypothetical protein
LVMITTCYIRTPSLPLPTLGRTRSPPEHTCSGQQRTPYP